MPTAEPVPPARPARRRFRRIAAQVLAVQIATLVGLWLLNAVYGSP